MKKNAQAFTKAVRVSAKTNKVKFMSRNFVKICYLPETNPFFAATSMLIQLKSFEQLIVLKVLTGVKGPTLTFVPFWHCKPSTGAQSQKRKTIIDTIRSFFILISNIRYR